MEINKPAVFTLLFIALSQTTLFILKLSHAIDWDWCWVLAPLWMPYSIIFISLAVAMVYVILMDIKERKSKRNG